MPVHDYKPRKSCPACRGQDHNQPCRQCLERLKGLGDSDVFVCPGDGQATSSRDTKIDRDAPARLAGEVVDHVQAALDAVAKLRKLL